MINNSSQHYILIIIEFFGPVSGRVILQVRSRTIHNNGIVLFIFHIKRLKRKINFLSIFSFCKPLSFFQNDIRFMQHHLFYLTKSEINHHPGLSTQQCSNENLLYFVLVPSSIRPFLLRQPSLPLPFALE